MPLVRAQSGQRLTTYQYTASWQHLPTRDQWAHSRCCSGRHSGNWAVGSWPAEKMIRILKEECCEVRCAAYSLYMALVMWSKQALQEIQSAPEWQCSILHIVFTQKLRADPGDLQFSSPSLHLTPFISAPPCAPPFHPVFLQHPYLLHHLTSQLSSLCRDWKNALVSCHSI